MIKIKFKTIREDDEKVKKNVDKLRSTELHGYDIVSTTNRSSVIKRAFNNIGIYPQSPQGIEELVKHIEPLQRAEIVRPIAFGTKGEIYKLSNGNVLKLFTDSYSDDVAWYRKILKRLHSGKATRHTLMIHHHGGFNATNLHDVDVRRGQNLYFMEMEELIPFGTILKDSGRSTTEASQNLDDLLDVFHQEYGSNPWPVARKRIKEIYKSYHSILTDKEIHQFITLFRDSYIAKEPINDFHAGNVGIRPNDDRANPTFVIFDR